MAWSDLLITEEVVRFGSGASLTAILSRPTSSELKPPHVVLLNAGLIHRVGPSRVYVRLARALARRGYPVFRVDIAGVGDSIGRDQRDAGGAVDDVRRLLDEAELRLGIADACLVGICSGADHAFDAAQRDARVGSTVLVNGALLPPAHFLPLQPVVERRARLRQYRKNLLSVAWWRLLRGRTAQGRSSKSRPPDRDIRMQGPSTRGLESTPRFGEPKEEALSPRNRGGLSRIVTMAWLPLFERKCRSLLLYSELSSSLDAFRMLTQPYLPRTPLVEIEVLRRADHSLILSAGQEGLLRAVVRHVSQARDGLATRRAGA